MTLVLLCSYISCASLSLVSEFVCLFPNSSETTKPDELEFWDAEGFMLKKTSGFVEPLAGKLRVLWACALGTLSSMNLQRICEVGRGWGD